MSRDFGSILRGDSGYSTQSSGGVIVLAQSAVAKSSTGTLVETELARCIVPGGLLGPNGSLEIVPLFKCTNSVNNKSFKILFGGVAFSTPAGTTLNTIQPYILIRNRGVQNSQVVFPAASIIGIGSAGADPTTGAVDTSVDQVISITGTLANAADTVTLEGYTIKILNPL